MKTLQNLTFFKTHELHEVLTKANILSESMKLMKILSVDHLSEARGVLENVGVSNANTNQNLAQKMKMLSFANRKMALPNLVI